MQTIFNKKIYIFIIISMIINIFYIVFKEEIPVHAGVIYEPGTDASTATWFYFSTNDNSSRAKFYRSTSGSVGDYNASLRKAVPEAYHGNSRKMFKEKYLNEYLWFTTYMPSYSNDDVRISDMSYFHENRQTSVGTSGDFLVKSKDMTIAGNVSALAYRYNLKTGTINDYGAYEGYNTGRRQILVGHFYSKKFEWRYLGYDENGEAMHNPYFPDDYYSSYGKESFTAHQIYWRDKAWYKNPWNHGLFRKVYGVSTKPRHANESNMEKYFLKKYPLFKQKGSASYWTNYIVPMSDPSLSATVWTGVQLTAGDYYYVVFTTGGPPQPNLRMSFFGVYESTVLESINNNYNVNSAIALRTRPTTVKSAGSNYTVKPRKELSQGEEVRIITSYMNQNINNEKAFTIKTTHGANRNSFTVNLAAEHDSNVGKLSNSIDAEYKGFRTYTNKTTLGPNEAVWFNYAYTVGKSNISGRKDAKSEMTLISYIPEQFYHNNVNNYSDDDNLTINVDVVGNNLKPEFVKYLDENGLETDNLTVGEEYTAIYKLVKKTKGTNSIPAASAKLWISFYDSPERVKVAKTTTPVNNKVYNSSGRVKTAAVLSDAGDYTYHEAKIIPQSTKICSYAVIQPSYYRDFKPNPNEVTEDDQTPENCIQNELNITVSDVKANPDLVVLPSGVTSRISNVGLSYSLTMDTKKGKDYSIPVIYTFAGNVIGSVDSFTMNRPGTIKIIKNFNVNVTKDKEDYLQVEANPKRTDGTRVIREYTRYNDNPYEDNVGWDIVTAKTNPDICPINHQSNSWNQTFSIREDWWWTVFTEHGYYTTGSSSSYTRGPYSYYEKFTISKLTMEVIDTKKEYNLLTTKPVLKAGQSFSLDIETYYRSNANIDSSIYFVDDGSNYSGNILVSYSNHGYWSGYSRNVSPEYRVSHSYSKEHDLYVGLSINGKDYLTKATNINKSGTAQNMKYTFELPLNEGKRVIHVGDKVKDGNYDIDIKTTSFYGTTLKPSSRNLCINQSFGIQIKGSTNDDVHTHINNDFN